MEPLCIRVNMLSQSDGERSMDKTCSHFLKISSSFILVRENRSEYIVEIRWPWGSVLEQRISSCVRSLCHGGLRW